jgi:predicted metalloprotease
VHTLRTVVVLLLAAVVSACTTTVSGSPVPGGSVTKGGSGGQSGVDPSLVKNTDGGESDRLAATVLTDLKEYWQSAFPAAFGKAWEDLSGGYYSVDTADPGAATPPCVRRSVDVEGNAFYCPTEDVMVWDRAALLPVLKERFGEAAVMFVLAHEMGHAVQRRSGLTLAEQRRNPEKYPTILIEAQADCYAGTFVHWVIDGKAGHLTMAKEQLDSVLKSLTTFRDPIGTEASDRNAHGDAFDRVSAFQDGYDKGTRLCAEMSVDNRTFTLRGFTRLEDAQLGGNLPFDKLLESITTDLNDFFGKLVAERGKQWSALQLRPTDNDPTCTKGDQGPIAFCPNGSEIDIATKGTLPELHTDIGDYATGTLLASRFALATLSVLAKPLDGADAQRQVLCLVGAYTGTLIPRQTGFTLSPGDMDEAVSVLLRDDFASRDTAGHGIPAAFDRVSTFRAGTLQGIKACGVS